MENEAILARDKRIADLLAALEPFAELPMTCETPGVAHDDDYDALLVVARAAVAAAKNYALLA